MNQEINQFSEQQAADSGEALPFPFNQKPFCRYESIEKRIETARVLVVDSLLRDTGDLSLVARDEMGQSASAEIRRERQIATMAVENILNNVERLVKDPIARVTHISELSQSTLEFEPDAIVVSGTLRDFDYYRSEILDDFGNFIRAAKTPVLAICGGHQLVGLSFGARVITLDRLQQHEQRQNRPV